jgi:serine/threonine protein kinase
VAIKILEKDKIKDQSDVERVTREIHILKIVRHPNVIQLYEVSKTIQVITFLFFRLLKHPANYSLSWNMPLGESYSIILSKGKDYKKKKDAVFTSKLYLVLTTVTKLVFVIVI